MDHLLGSRHPDHDRVLEYLENEMPGWPFEPEIDDAFVAELLDDFTRCSVLEQVKLFRWYHDNRPPTQRVRSSLRKWVAKAQARW